MTKKKKRTKETGPVKFTVPLPPEVHLALCLASVHSGRSNSTLIRDVVEQTFDSHSKPSLKLLKPPTDSAAWKRVSVFLPRDLREYATHEVRRQHGNPDDARFSGSLASAIAALVAQQYAPAYRL